MRSDGEGEGEGEGEVWITCHDEEEDAQRGDHLDDPCAHL